MMKKKLQKQFGNHFRQLRKSKNLSQDAVAEKSGTSASYISEIEGGNANPTLYTTERLAQGLGVEISELFFFRYSQVSPDEIRERIKAIADNTDNKTLQGLHNAVLTIFNPHAW